MSKKRVICLKFKKEFSIHVLVHVPDDAHEAARSNLEIALDEHVESILCDNAADDFQESLLADWECRSDRHDHLKPSYIFTQGQLRKISKEDGKDRPSHDLAHGLACACQDKRECPLYVSRLTFCRACEGFVGEGRALPTECPGVAMSDAQWASVWYGEQDYEDGRWVDCGNEEGDDE